MDLIPEPGPLGIPVDPAILLGLKVFGFWLHMVFMNLWLVGIPLGLLLMKVRPRVSHRLFQCMPFFMAFGINAGIVPLLFIQTLYAPMFYPATILQAWFWFLVIPLLMVAYYAVYLVSAGRFRTVAGVVAFLLLAWIGLSFSSALSLSESPDRWSSIFLHTANGGAVSGTYFFLSAEVLCRYGVVVGLALGTLAAYLALDAHLFTEDRAYRRQIQDLVPLLAGLGMAVFGVAGWFYRPLIEPYVALYWVVLAGAGPVGVAVASGVYRSIPSVKSAAGVGLLQAVSLGLNAVVRQIGQSSHYRLWFNAEQLPVRGEWGSLVVFLMVLLAGLIAVGWIARVVFTHLPAGDSPDGFDGESADNV